MLGVYVKSADYNRAALGTVGLGARLSSLFTYFIMTADLRYMSDEGCVLRLPYERQLFCRIVMLDARN